MLSHVFIPISLRGSTQSCHVVHTHVIFVCMHPRKNYALQRSHRMNKAFDLQELDMMADYVRGFADLLLPTLSGPSYAIQLHRCESMVTKLDTWSMGLGCDTLRTFMNIGKLGNDAETLWHTIILSHRLSGQDSRNLRDIIVRAISISLPNFISGPLIRRLVEGDIPVIAGILLSNLEGCDKLAVGGR